VLLRLCAVGLLGGLASAGQAARMDGQVGIEQQIQAAVQAGDFQGAMVAAHLIEDDRARFAQEADILHLAHSYRAALERAHEAYALGERSLLLLARGAQAAGRVRDQPSLDLFLNAMDAELKSASGGAVDVDAWRAFYAELVGHQKQLASEAAGLQTALSRAHTVTLVVGGLLLLGFWFRRPQSKASLG
jgi:hypothetical protein